MRENISNDKGKLNLFEIACREWKWKLGIEIGIERINIRKNVRKIQNNTPACIQVLPAYSVYFL